MLAEVNGDTRVGGFGTVDVVVPGLRRVPERPLEDALPVEAATFVGHSAD